MCKGSTRSLVLAEAVSTCEVGQCTMHACVPLFWFPQDSALTSMRQELQSQRQALAEKEEQVCEHYLTHHLVDMYALCSHTQTLSRSYVVKCCLDHSLHTYPFVSLLWLLHTSQGYNWDISAAFGAFFCLFPLSEGSSKLQKCLK